MYLSNSIITCLSATTLILKLTLNSRFEIFLRLEYKGANQGRGYSDSELNLILNKYIKKAGINTEGKRHGTHSMRHSLSSNLLKDGVELPVISGILGHSSSEITMRYFWMNTEQLRKLSLEAPCEEN